MKTGPKWIYFILSLFFLIVCGARAEEESYGIKEYWATCGNGFIIEICRAKYKMYEVAKKSLLPIGRGIIRNEVMY
jgi:hypothetical protein